MPLYRSQAAAQRLPDLLKRKAPKESFSIPLSEGVTVAHGEAMLETYDKLNGVVYEASPEKASSVSHPPESTAEQTTASEETEPSPLRKRAVAVQKCMD